jgi:hypothetical protein
VRCELVHEHGDHDCVGQERGGVGERARYRAAAVAGVLATDDGACSDAHGCRPRRWPDDLAGHGHGTGYYDMRNGTLQTVYSLETHLDYRYHNHGDGVFFIATVCEDSLFRPFDQKSRLW